MPNIERLYLIFSRLKCTTKYFNDDGEVRIILSFVEARVSILT